MNVYVIDTRDSLLASYFRDAALRQSGTNDLIEVTPQWSMNQIINRVKDYTTAGALRKLRLCAHGNAGTMDLGSQGLTQTSVSHFAILANHDRFGPASSIEIHACAFASGSTIGCDQIGVWENPALSNEQVVVYSTGCARPSAGTISATAPGLPTLQSIANAAGVKVVAAVNAQRPDPHFRFEGPVVVRHPQPGH